MIQSESTSTGVRFPANRLLKAGLGALLVIIAFGLGLEPGKIDTRGVAAVANDVSSSILTAPSDFPNIRIKNFGRMDENFYRGAQPKPNDYEALAALGIKTILDLRDDPTSYEKTKAEAVGIRYINIPMSDKRKPADEVIATFFTIANDPASLPLYVHCIGGRHRTGLIGAVYRFDKYGWDYDQAYREMKNYDYYSRWGHGDIKEYVQEYYERMKLVKPIVTAGMPEGEEPTSKPITAPPPPKVTE